MIRTIADFEYHWSQELEATQKILKHVTDRSLPFSSTSEGRTIGRLAWHIVITIPEMMGKTGLTVPGVPEHDPLPAHAKAICSADSEAAIALLEKVKAGWTDATLEQTDELYGERWKRGQTLTSL